MADPKLVVCGIAGSLRAGSYNRALLRAAQELLPEGMELRLFDRLRDIPPYDGDVEAKGMPEPVLALKEAIASADAVLVTTPEYNHSVPGVLKNAVDWASRPPGQSAFRGKTVAVMGASTGNVGTARAQVDLRTILAANGARLLPGPEMLVARAQERFDGDGRLTDERTRKLLRTLLEALGAAAPRRG